MAAHAAQGREGGIILADSTVVLPGPTQGLGFVLIFEEVRNFPNKGSKLGRRRLRKEREERVDDLVGCHGALVVVRDVGTEACQSGGVAAQKVERPFYDSTMSSVSSALLLGKR